MNTHVNHCHLNGRLVPAAEPIPDDLADFVWSPTVLCGCNSLVCETCKGPVRWKLIDDPASRLYLCDCASKEIQVWRWIEQWPADDFTDSVPNWRCGGHPVRSCPFDLNGVNVAASPDWAALLEGAARGTVSPTNPPEFLPAHDLGWLEHILATVSPEEQHRFDQALAGLLLIPFAGPTKTLLGFASRTALPASTERIIAQVANNDPDSWTKDPDVTRDVIVIAERSLTSAGPTPPVVNALRHLVFRAEQGAAGLVWSLAKHDARWLAAATPDLLERYPQRASHLFSAFKAHSPVEFSNAIDAALTAGAGKRYDLERAIWDCFDESEREQWLKRLEPYPVD